METTTLLALVLGLLIGLLIGAACASVTTRTVLLGRQSRLGAERDLLQARVSDLESAAAQDRELTSVLSPLRDSLGRVERQVATLERDRVEQYARLGQQLQTVTASGEALRDQTAALVGALRSSNSRGTWGETQLRRVVEHAGMLARVDFTEQPTGLSADGRTARPDLVVRLPGGKNIVVDAKAPMTAFLDAGAQHDPDRQRQLLTAHAKALRGHVETLASRAYWQTFSPTPEMVVCFVPGDAILAAALDADPALHEDAMARHVVLASPATLLALLRTVAYTWQQDALAGNAKELFEVGRELYDRLGTLGGRTAKLGTTLHRAVEDYNALVGTSARPRPDGYRPRRTGAGRDHTPPADRGRAAGRRPGASRVTWRSAEPTSDGDASSLQVTTQVAGQGEQQALLGGPYLVDRVEAPLGEPGEDVAHEQLRHARTARDAHRAHTVQPRVVDLVGVVHEVAVLRAVLKRHLDQAHGVGRVARADHDDEIGLGRDLLDGDLSVLCRVADVVTRRVLQVREALPQPPHGLHRLVDRQRRLREPDHAVRVAHRHRVDVVRTVDEVDVLGCLAGRAHDLLVAVVADQQDVDVVSREPLRLVVHLRDQRAGRVDRLQLPLGCLLVDHGGHTMGREDHRRALGHLVRLLDEDRPPLLQRGDDMAVVHDLLAHVDRRTVQVQGLLDGDNGTVDTRAVAARCRQQDALGLCSGSSRRGVSHGSHGRSCSADVRPRLRTVTR
jgi:DNA recombination protein RmuC